MEKCFDEGNKRVCRMSWVRDVSRREGVTEVASSLDCAKNPVLVMR